MIFVVVGTQKSFDRLVETIDEWAGRTGRSDVFAQIYKTKLVPKNIEWVDFMEPIEFNKCMAQADVIISHAGMGTIISALEMRKPILVMPRRAALREHRNDHQMATARSLGGMGYVEVAFDEKQLVHKLDHLQDIHSTSKRISDGASPELLTAIREFISE